MMLEAALVKGKGSILRRLSSGDEILDGGLFIYLFIFSEERGAEMRVDENASSVYVPCLFKFNLKFPHCSDLTLENTTQYPQYSPEANRYVFKIRIAISLDFVGDRDA